MRAPTRLASLKKATALSVIASTSFGLAGCVEAETEPDDPNIYDEIETYVGQEVSLSAEVLDVLSPTSFTVVNEDDPTVDPLLVLNGNDTDNVLPGMPIQVTGVVMESFDPETAEEETGKDLDDALYEDWIGEPYLEVTAIDAPEASDV